MTYTREGRSTVERSDQRSLTLDDTLTASHPGGVKVSLWRWACRYPKWPLILTTSVLLTPFLIVSVSLMFIAALPITVIPAIWYAKRVREHFLYGDANPGLVISTSPFRIAVWVDLTKGEGSFPALSVKAEPPFKHQGKPAEVGTRLATVALYDIGSEEDLGYWENLDPRPVEPVAAREEDARKLFESFSAEQWERLEKAVESVKPTRAGLFRLS